jgi:hypothetical protein
MTRLILLALLTSLSGIALADPTVDTTYDKFKDRTDCTTSKKQLKLSSDTRSLFFRCAASVEGSDTHAAPDSLFLSFTGQSLLGDFFTNHDSMSAIFIVDGDRWEIKPKDYESTMVNGDTCYRESFVLPLEPQQLAKLASARSAECEIDTTEFKFGPDEQAELRAMARQIGIYEGPPKVVPYEATAHGVAFVEAVGRATVAHQKATADAVAAVHSTDQYRAAEKEAEDANTTRQAATGQDRLDASKAWLAAKAKLAKIERDGVSHDAAVIAATADLASATDAMARDKAAYVGRPTTVPAK